MIGVAAQERSRWLDGVAEDLRTAEVVREPPDYGSGLTDAQLEVLRDSKSRERALLVGRRGGKTWLLCVLLMQAAARPDSRAVYLTLTRRNAKLIVWRWLKRAAHRLGVEFSTNETDLVMTLAGGGEILLGGADKIDEIEKWRGFFWDLCVLDEMGSFPPSLLAQLIDEVIAPATFDYDGRVVYSGTPGYTLTGRWYELSGPAANCPVYHWTAQENTAVPGLWDRMLEHKEKRGYDDDNPTWRREFLGEWVDDAEALVFPLSPERNTALALPRVGRTGANILPSGWRFVLGIDVGYVNACSFVVTAAHPLVPETYTVHAEKHPELLARQVGNRIRTLRKEVAERLGVPVHLLERCPIVMDAGGQGKPYAEECRRVFGLPVTNADKQQKLAWIRLARDDIRGGHHKILAGEHCDPLREEHAVLDWNEDKTMWNEDHKRKAGGLGDDATMGWLYSLRRLKHYRSDDPEAPPGSARAEELRMMEHMLKPERKRRGRAGWDR